MKMLRLNSPMGIDYMRDFLLPDEDYTKDDLVDVLKTQLKEGYERTLILQAWEDVVIEEEENEVPRLQSFLIALAPEMQQHVFLLQAWVRPGTDPSIADKMWLSLLVWTEGLGRSRIKMETLRDPTAFNRRWNFKTFSTIMQFEIPEQFEENLLNHALLIGKDLIKENDEISKVEVSRDLEEDSNDRKLEDGIQGGKDGNTRSEGELGRSGSDSVEPSGSNEPDGTVWDSDSISSGKPS